MTASSRAVFFPEVHLIDLDLNNLFEFKEKGSEIGLPQPHEQETASKKERDLVLALGFGTRLSVGHFTTGASMGMYLTIDLDSKSPSVGTFASVGMPGGIAEKAPGSAGFERSVGPSLTIGFGDARNGFFGPANSTGINGGVVSVDIVDTADYQGITVSGGAGAGITSERTSTISTGEINSYDLQRCVHELYQYIMRGTGY